jgi:hypothetical protein
MTGGSELGCMHVFFSSSVKLLAGCLNKALCLGACLALGTCSHAWCGGQTLPGTCITCPYACTETACFAMACLALLSTCLITQAGISVHTQCTVHLEILQSCHVAEGKG